MESISSHSGILAIFEVSMRWNKTGWPSSVVHGGPFTATSATFLKVNSMLSWTDLKILTLGDLKTLSTSSGMVLETWNGEQWSMSNLTGKYGRIVPLEKVWLLCVSSVKYSKDIEKTIKYRRSSAYWNVRFVTKQLQTPNFYFYPSLCFTYQKTVLSWVFLTTSRAEGTAFNHVFAFMECVRTPPWMGLKRNLVEGVFWSDSGIPRFDLPE